MAQATASFLKSRTGWLLVCVLLVAFVLRFLGLDFGLPNDSRPDEIPIRQIILHYLLDPIFSRGNWQLHPRFLNYPSLYFYLHSVIFTIYYGIGHLLGWFADWRSFLIASNVNPTSFHMILRWFNVFTGTGMVAIMALLGWRWSGRHSVAVMAALLAATNYLLVRNSHFGSVDMLMTLGVTASLWAILRYRKQKTPQALRLACILCGLSVGAKYPAALLLLPLWVALLEPHVSSERIDWSGFLHSVWKPTGLVVLVFLLTSPYILLDFPEFLRDFRYESVYFFTFRVPGLESGWLFYPDFALWHGVGPWVLLFFGLGVWRRWQQPENRWADATLLAFLVGFYILLGFNERVMTRYALPMVPVILLYAAFGLDELVRSLQTLLKIRRPWQTTSLWLLAGGLLSMPSLVQSVGFNLLLMKADTRNLAREWILANVPRQTPVATGPRLGLISLPGEYGQFIVQTGPEFLMPPPETHLQMLNTKDLLTNTYADLALFKKLNIRYVVTFQGLPIYGNRPWEMETLMKNAKPVFYANPLKPGKKPGDVGRFDPLDAFYLPYDNFEAFDRPGPVIAIFDLAQAPQAKPEK